MTVTNISNGEIFTVRSYKRSQGLIWANNYEVRANQDVAFAQTAIADLVNRIVNLERRLHPNTVTIDRVVVSTYQRDSVPYNPEAFTTIPIELTGNATLSGDPMPIEYCVFVRRVVQSGRTGKLLYRGCLAEGQVETQGLRAVLTTTHQNDVQNALNEWYGTVWLVSGNPFDLVLASGDENLNVRLVQGLTAVRKITIKQAGNAYFDRANP